MGCKLHAVAVVCIRKLKECRVKECVFAPLRVYRVSSGMLCLIVSHCIPCSKPLTLS